MRRELVAKRLSRGWCLGGSDFKKDMQKEAVLRGAHLDRERFAGLEPDEIRLERESAWEERLQALASAGKVELRKLSGRKSDPVKVLLAAALKQSTSVSNAWLSRRLDMGQPASASQFVRRLLLQPEGQQSAVSLLSRVLT